MGAPETGTEIEATGRWVTVQPGLPSELTDFLGVIQGLLEVLLVVLNIALAILQVIKAFLVGFLDPIVAIIEAIIDEILGLLQDIRQLGLYLSGDWALMTPNFENILGGYQGYERRMVGRLTNRSDPTRPNFTSRTAVLAIFLYASVDTTGIARLIQMIEKIMNFLGQTVPVQAYTVPTSLRVTYGLDGASLATFGPMMKAIGQGDVPNAANIRWRMAPPPSGTPVLFPSLAPKGFLVEVSTVPDGLLLAYDTPVKNKQPGTQGRVYGLVRDPKTRLPFRLYGGSDMVDVGDLADGVWEADDGSDTTTRLYAFRSAADDVPIPINVLKDGDKYLLQRTFYVKAGFFNVAGPGQGFAGVLQAEDMPYEATFEIDSSGEVVATPEPSPATTVYVRISAVTESVANAVGFTARSQQTGPLTAPLQFWTISSSAIFSESQVQGYAMLGTGSFSPNDKTEPSFPLTVTFPGASTQEYLETVTLALVVLALSRSDLAAGLEEEPEGPGVDSSTADAQLAAAQLAVQEATARLDAAREEQERLQQQLSDLQNQALQETSLEVQAQLAEQGNAVGARIMELEDELAVLEAELASAEEMLALYQDQATAAASYEAALPPFTVGQGRLATGLEEIARYVFPMILLRNKWYFNRKAIPPENFRANLLLRCRAVANDLYAKSGPLGDLEGVVASAGEVLRTFKWSDLGGDYTGSEWDMTILESLESDEVMYGLGLNPTSIGASDLEFIEALLSRMAIDRLPGFMIKDPLDPNDPPGTEDSFIMMDRGSADFSPVLYRRTLRFNPPPTIEFCRNVFFRVGGFYGAAATVLNVAAGSATMPQVPEGQNWIAIRLFPQGLPGVEAALQEIIGFIQALAAGLQAVTDIIVAYIEFLEARIRELQALIERISGVLDILISFDLPSVSALVVTGNGTDGILQQFITAEDKPSDGVSAYSAGMVILAGGLPSFLLDLMQAFFPEEA